tara:strand:- start:259 stop:615 length:357 start_codon:yes stop_codon:yes gene_type:complete
MKKLFLLSLIFSLSSCGTIFTGTSEAIVIDSNVDGAIVEFDGVEVGQTPFTTKVKKSFNGMIKVSADGYKDKSFQLLKSFNGISILNLGNLLGWGIDFATGALNKFDQKGYEITLKNE